MKKEPLRTKAGDERKRPEPMRQILAGSKLSESLKVLKPGGANKKALAETILEAHKSLIKANPINRSKFKDVVNHLRKERSRTATME